MLLTLHAVSLTEITYTLNILIDGIAFYAKQFKSVQYFVEIYLFLWKILKVIMMSTVFFFYCINELWRVWCVDFSYKICNVSGIFLRSLYVISMPVFYSWLGFFFVAWCFIYNVYVNLKIVISNTKFAAIWSLHDCM